MSTQISFETPPVWDRVKEMFTIGGGTLFAYGDTVYNPGKIRIGEDLLRHEETHLEQQDGSREKAAEWWDQYLADPEFRIQQEVEAYGEQFKFICRNANNGKYRNQQARWLHALAGQLSSPMYGSVIKHAEAYRRIKDYASGKSIQHIEKELE